MKAVKKIGFICIAILMVVVTACGSNNNSKSPSPAADSKDGNKVTEQPAAADPFGKYKDPVTIRIGQGIDPTDKSLPQGDTPENNQYTRHIKEQLNVDTKIVWQASKGKDYDQKVNLAIASDDLPDLVIVNDAQLRQMVKAGQLADLSEVFDQYASPAIKGIIEKTEGRALEAVNFDGKMMALPNVTARGDAVHTMWIRQDWLDKLKLEVPKTVDELAAVAKAFVEQDPDGNNQKDTIGISGPQAGGKIHANFITSSNNTFGLDPIFSAYLAYPGFWLEGKDGKPVYGSIQPEVKDALAKLREMYAAGLIDREMSIRKDAAEPVVAGKSGIFFGPFWMGYWPLPDAIKNDPTANWQAYALPLDKNGEYSPHMATPSSQFLAVRKGYEHPEVALKLLNLLVRDEATFDVSVTLDHYPVRIVYAPVDEIEFTLQSLQEVLAGTKKPEDLNIPGYKLLVDDANKVTKTKLEPYDKNDIQYWNTDDMGAWSRLYSIFVGGKPLMEKRNEVYSLTYSQTKTMESRWANLEKLETETFLKIIMGAAPLESFDMFVEDWKKQDGDKVTEEVAEAVKK
ncbi:putative aldouronate transport system substrate-binding protein [Paenibacillus castaneae]|uniref:extracellular solute-binding protein n=1 Tax=Paenibacillus castaneae TaxID=474957 RepID=UPI000C9CFE83|nr:extracellular solute-binding protein [Paenibacillus castaneae]NIK79686.1 putative aldouronate transport system substrate-binding protein [Paenibacillus castaneae]